MKHQQNTSPRLIFHCGECALCEPVTKFHTLSVTGKPTLGKCPYIKDRCVLLSEQSCGYYKPKKDTAYEDKV